MDLLLWETVRFPNLKLQEYSSTTANLIRFPMQRRETSHDSRKNIEESCNYYNHINDQPYNISNFLYWHCSEQFL